MTEKPLPQSDINGDVPDVEGSLCQAFIVQSFLQDGVLVEPCNTAFICCAGRWHRLYFDHGFVFWREQESAPEAYESPGDGWSYSISDLLPRVSDCPTLLEKVHGAQDDKQTAITFTFAGNRQIRLCNDFATDTTSYSVI